MLMITGSTSLVGRLVVQALADSGTPCRALVRAGAFVPPDSFPLMERIAGDIADARVLDAALDGVSTMLLVSRVQPDMLPRERRLLQAAARHRVSRVLKLSVADAAPDATRQSARWHWIGEQGVREMSAETAIVRSQRPMQHLYTQIDALLTQHQFIGCQGNGRAADVDARDVADVLIRLATAPPGMAAPAEPALFEVTGAVALSPHDLARALGAALGHPISFVDCTAPDFVRALTAGGIAPWQADDCAEWQAAVKTRGELPPTDTVARVLGRPPRTAEAFANEFAASLRFARGLPPHSHAEAAATAIAAMRETAHGASVPGRSTSRTAPPGTSGQRAPT